LFFLDYFSAIFLHVPPKLSRRQKPAGSETEGRIVPHEPPANPVIPAQAGIQEMFPLRVGWQEPLIRGLSGSRQCGFSFAINLFFQDYFSAIFLHVPPKLSSGEKPADRETEGRIAPHEPPTNPVILAKAGIQEMFPLRFGW
jgi:hypothetical protein